MGMVSRTPNFKTLPLNMVGSSRFGRYPKIDAEYTYNMMMSQGALVPYCGYKVGIGNSNFANATEGRGLFNSAKLNKIIAVFGKTVYRIDLEFNQALNEIQYPSIVSIGQLNSETGHVYITENNKPQIVLSDGSNIYIYDQQATQFTGTVSSASGDVITYSGSRTLIAGEPVIFAGGSLPSPLAAGVTYYVTDDNNLTSTTFSVSTSPTEAYLAQPLTLGGTGTGTFETQGRFQVVDTTFDPGQLDFHDTYILCATERDSFYSPPATNTWRLSAQNNAFMFPDDSSSIGLIETKPDRIKAVVRFPSGGNMIFVMGETVTEAWFDTGSQLFPYQRNNQYNIDYGCLNAKSVTRLNDLVVWLGFNEKSGPIIMYSKGSVPTKISTDGIDFFMSQLQNPEDCEAFLFRQDGHTIYHLNFLSDRYSLFYDFNTEKFFNASDQDLNQYRIDKLVFFKNQYFGITNQDGNFYIVDTTIFFYESPNTNGLKQIYEIPRSRTTTNVRLPSQDYFIINDLGFTIESGETNYLVQEIPNQDEIPFTLVTMNGDTLVTMTGDTLVTEQLDPDSGTTVYRQSTPRVDLAISYNGGATYDSYYKYELPHIGKRRNRVKWWQCGVSNDSVFQFKFWSTGRVVVLEGEVNIRV